MGEFSLDNVNDMCLDVLKEIGNIGAGNATTAIANMIGTKIDMQVPTVKLMEASQLGSAICPEEETIVGILLEVSHDISGSIMFLMRMDSARYLVNKLLMGMGGESEPGQEFSEMELSALKEIGNIIAGAYLAAISSMTNLTMQPSVPMIAVDMAAAILSVPAIQFGLYGDNALFIETEFGDEVMINGYFILMPDQDSYGKILASLGIVI
jgi:chemotaxis protein CheC